MNFQSNEQVTHDRINLARLVRRLEKSVAAEDWDAGHLPPRATWIKTQQTLQKLKYARKLLDNVELHESDQDAFQRYAELRATLARLHSVVKEVDQRVTPSPTRPTPILPIIPLPRSTRPAPVPSIRVSEEEGQLQTRSSGDDSTASAHDLLLSPSDTSTLLDSAPVSATLLPADPPSSAAPSAKPAPAFLQNSSALQEELSAQLAQMATQLKRNALHFSDALEKDKDLVQETQGKLEHNYDVMSKERVRVRDHHSKSWGTTWLVMLSLLVALVGFILTFLVIRIT
ncbi:uncharacterized protein B0H18DRAFT_985979 [Fomitopsis serialis]|uniref:uncharacterized protein n=1 Tax=Fomitopsis serialis TaxID=139415 RepID=UPI002007C1A0|nr:uncharacterized protein B0H18DRAFT_985979 [Neoantrodia serialis]KAH9932510.1 hypothetical protein B0H18DRAFT_985979 [Neoantrodia serialis]